MALPQRAEQLDSTAAAGGTTRQHCRSGWNDSTALPQRVERLDRTAAASG